MNVSAFCRKIISMIDVGWMELDEIEGANIDTLKEMNLICAKKLNDKKCVDKELYFNIYNKVNDELKKNGITPLEINKNHYLSKREQQKEWKKFSQELLEEIYGKDNSTN